MPRLGPRKRGAMELIGSATTIYEGPQASVKLRELGLTENDIIMAVEAAEIERRSCSLLEPSVAPGFKAWVAGFRTLAELITPRGFAKTETKGLPRLLNPETSIAIAVVTGDSGTGLMSENSRSKTPRGAQSVFFVRSNETQLNLFPGSSYQAAPDETEEITWWLLIYSDGDAVRAELSLPVGLGEDNRLSVWEERIMIPVPDLSLPPGRREDEEPPLELEINIRPRR